MAEKLRAGFYCGPVEQLAGRRALIRIEAESPDTVLAQFDEPVVINTGTAYIAAGTPLNFGWHRFPLAVFDLDLEFE